MWIQPRIAAIVCKSWYVLSPDRCTYDLTFYRAMCFIVARHRSLFMFVYLYITLTEVTRSLHPTMLGASSDADELRQCGSHLALPEPHHHARKAPWPRGVEPKIDLFQGTPELSLQPTIHFETRGANSYSNVTFREPLLEPLAPELSPQPLRSLLSHLNIDLGIPVVPCHLLYCSKR